jgi:tRNA (cmo5U34)-methyltransferase
MSCFDDPAGVARYAEGPRRLVPGFLDLQRMALLLLAERAPPDARILVLGAGGGLELKVFADAQPGWHFDGVDPSAEMLRLAETTIGAHASRVRLHQGYIDTAPPGPFDGAACLLTLHFIPPAERAATLRAVHDRLKPGAVFVTAHHSIPGDEAERALWLARYAAFAASSGVPRAQAESAGAAIAERLPVLSPAEDEALLRDAGFRDVALFYAGFSFRGWVSRA